MMADSSTSKACCSGEAALNERILELPMENVLWMIGKLENYEQDESDGEENESEEDSGEVWTICDSHNFLIGARTQRTGETPGDCVHQLLAESMRQPLSWSPRRPKYVSLRNSDQHVELNVQQFGIVSTCNPPQTLLQKNKFRNVLSDPVTSCSTCDRSGSRRLFQFCPDCEATLYCSKTCLEKDRQGQMEGMPGHSYWCGRMREYVQDTNSLAKFPFTFAKETTGPQFDEQKYKAFQQRLGVFGRGLWRREWSLYLSTFGGYYGELCDAPDNDYVIPELNSMYLHTSPPPPPVFSLTSWLDYVKWRALDVDSPVAVLMQWPLTLYHVIVNLFPKHYSDVAPLKGKKRLVIHMLGVEKELDILPAFYELGNLMPETDFDIVLIGNEIAERLDGKVITHKPQHGSNSMTFTAFYGFYHSYSGANPDLAIGYNAGIGAYPSWSYTLSKICREKIPTFLTDYFRISCHCTRPPLLHQGLGDIFGVEINPFRCPVRRYVEEHLMPSYSNGYVFSIRHGLDPACLIEFGENGEIL